MTDLVLQASSIVWTLCLLVSGMLVGWPINLLVCWQNSSADVLSLLVWGLNS